MQISNFVEPVFAGENEVQDLVVELVFEVQDHIQNQ